MHVRARMHLCACVYGGRSSAPAPYPQVVGGQLKSIGLVPPPPHPLPSLTHTASIHWPGTPPPSCPGVDVVYDPVGGKSLSEALKVGWEAPSLSPAGSVTAALLQAAGLSLRQSAALPPAVGWALHCLIKASRCACCTRPIIFFITHTILLPSLAPSLPAAAAPTCAYAGGQVGRTVPGDWFRGG